MPSQLLRGNIDRTQCVSTVVTVKEFKLDSTDRVQLVQPVTAVPDGRGRLFIVDSGRDIVYCAGIESGIIFQFGEFGQGPGQFNRPQSIAIDRAGNIYVADQANDRVQKFDNRGNYLLSFGSAGQGPGQFDQPSGIAVDIFGFVHVADAGNNRIQRFDNQGRYVSQFGEYGWGEGFLNSPAGLAMGPDNNLVVADKGNNRIQFFNTNGRSIGCSAKLDLADGIVIDGAGTVYFADYMKGGIYWVRGFTDAPQLLEGAGQIQASSNSQLSLDEAHKTLYLCDPAKRKLTILEGK